MRLAIDTGGTFTDLVLESDSGEYSIFKSDTTPWDPVEGILDVLGVAAAELGLTRTELLGQSTSLIHGTTRALNAVLTQGTAKTAFLTTEGHPDILVLREGGRPDVFDLTQRYPEPYVPRALTFEVRERIGADGDVVLPLDEQSVLDIAARLRDIGIEAVAVCLLWSIVNPAHEARVRELLQPELPGVPVVLSHELNPCLREYRRASATCIDASLRPLMSDYLESLKARLRDAGFAGRLLMVTSAGGALDADDVAKAPIHALNSGPAMAPVAGRHFVQMDADADLALIADTGGTSYDVSVVRGGEIPWTRETWLGPVDGGHITGFPSVDVRSVGAGGGSIAWIDAGGLLHVGPDSAGADPGPACYGRGGSEATVTDACVVLGFIDPEFFLGGRVKLDADASARAIRERIGKRLGLGDAEAAAAIVRVATEHMVGAIEQITIYQGIDPADAVLVGGGGAAGLNVVPIARRLGCRRVLMPDVGSVLSAAGGLISDLVRDFEIPFSATSKAFDSEAVIAVIDALRARASDFIERSGVAAPDASIEFAVEARYPAQAWELKVPIRVDHCFGKDDVRTLCESFHNTHQDVFAMSDRASHVEFESWHARARCRLTTPAAAARPNVVPREPQSRTVYFLDVGEVNADVWRVEQVPVGSTIVGPAIVEAPTTTIVVDPGATFSRLQSGTILIVPAVTDATAAPRRATSARA